MTNTKKEGELFMKKIIQHIIVLLLICLLTPLGMAVDEADGRVQSRRGNPSPSAEKSNIDEYTFQDEQVNLSPDDEDVLVLRANQKILLNRYVTRTFPLKKVDSPEVRNIFRELTAKEGGRAEVIRDKVSGECFLQVVVPRWQVPFIESVIPLLDEEWLQENQDGSMTTYYKARYRDIEDIDLIASEWGGEGFSVLDRNNNSATRRDEPYRISSYLKGAVMVDVPEHQGRFHIKVYEVSISNDLRLGLDYIAWKNGPGRNLFDFGFAGYDVSERFVNVSGFLNPFLQRTINTAEYSIHRQFTNATRFAYANFLLTSAYVDFLASKGKAKVLAEGTVHAKSGDVAYFGATEQVVSFKALPLDPGEEGFEPTRISDSCADGEKCPETGDYGLYDRSLGHGSSGQVGLSIEIEPVILLESMEVEVAVETSNVSGYTPQGLPIIQSSRAVTRARMKGGVPLVIAGLTRDEKVETKQGIPFLSSLPGLGYLFGGENNINRKTQLLIVIECEVETGGESVLANAPEIQTIANQVVGESIPQVPRNSFGFDMWLLGNGSGADI